LYVNDASEIVTWSDDGTIKFWNAASETTPTEVVFGESILNTKFLTNGRRLFISGPSSFAILDFVDKKVVLKGPGNRNLVSADGEFVLSQSPKDTEAFRVDTLKSICKVAFPTRAAIRTGIGFTGTGGFFAFDEKQIRVWHFPGCDANARSLQQLNVTGALASPDGAHLVAWDSKGAVTLWNLETDGATAVAAHSDTIRGALFSSDGSHLLTWSFDKSLLVTDVSSGRKIAQMNFEAPVTLARFNRTETSVWAADSMGTVRYSPKLGAADGLEFHHDGEVTGWEFYDDGMLTWSMDGSARLWRFGNFGLGFISDFRRLNGPGQRLVSADKSLVVLWSKDEIGALKTANDSGVGSFKVSEAISSVAITPSGTLIAAAMPSSLCIWSTKAPDDGCSVFPKATAAIDPQHERLLVLGATDETAIVETGGDGRVKTTHIPFAAQSGFFRDVEDEVVLCSKSGDIGLYKAVSGTVVRRVKAGGPVECVATNTHQYLYAEQADAGLVRWNLADNAVVQARALPPGVTTLKGGLDYGKLIWWSRDGTVGQASFSEAPDIKTVSVGGPITGVVASDDAGMLFAFSKGSGGSLVDFGRNGKITPLQVRADVMGARFIDDGRRLVTWSNDNIVSLWDTATGRNQLKLPHDGSVFGILPVPDAALLATWDSDGNLRILDAADGILISQRQFGDLVDSVSLASGRDALIIHLNRGGIVLWPIWTDVARLYALAQSISERARFLSAADLCRASDSSGGCGLEETSAILQRQRSYRLASATPIYPEGSNMELGVLPNGQVIMMSDREHSTDIEFVEYDAFTKILTLVGENGFYDSGTWTLSKSAEKQLMSNDKLSIIEKASGKLYGYDVPILNY
jgi:WD40 repeat protein